MSQRDVSFGFMVAASDSPGTDDAGLYATMLRDAQLGYDLGYEGAWIIEHHFSNYFPQPSPIAILSHLAARFPGLDLGTMVLVTPWHHPMRLAGEIAALSHLCTGNLHFGLGRGNAQMEYDAFDIDMAQAKDRFEDSWRILELAMEGKPFTYEGKVLKAPRQVQIRPTPQRDKINFYGGMWQAASASKIAGLGLPPMCNGTHPLEVQRAVLEAWAETARSQNMPTDVTKVVACNLIVADTDEEAYQQGRKYMPRWFQVQAEHYQHDITRNRDLPDYRPFAEMQARRVAMSDPAGITDFLDVSLVGSPETIKRRLQEYLDVGFNSIILLTSTPGIPEERHREWLTRFAKEVAPEFSKKFAPRTKAVV
ncbi:LLM class flavin-dependent oxidoreductase [soil metagenome]